MKSLSLICGVGIILLVSCSTETMETTCTDHPFYATIEQGDSRVYADENLMVLWHKDDRVSIFDHYSYNREYRFIGETGSNAGAFDPVDTPSFVTGNDLPHVIAVYPYAESTSVSNNENLSLTLPVVQTFSENSFGIGCNTMVSFTEDNYLRFKNVGGYLAIKLYGADVRVSSITLKGNNGELLAGDASVKADVSAPPVVVMDTDNASPEITISCETPVALSGLPAKYKEFWFVMPPVTFTKGFTVVVTDSKGNTYVKSTSKNIVVERNKLYTMSPFEIIYDDPDVDFVDLGLSVKWAKANLGVSSPEGSGDYFAWGETAPKEEYSWATYKWCNGTYSTLTKYCFTTSRGYNGFTDNVKKLGIEDDAAHSVLGNSCRLPSDSEWMELANSNNCLWTWTSLDGVQGYRVTSKRNGRRIFLPAAGRYYRTYGLQKVGTDGYYWSSDLNDTNTVQGYCLHFTSDVSSIAHYGSERSSGHVIRPVKE